MGKGFCESVRWVYAYSYVAHNEVSTHWNLKCLVDFYWQRLQIKTVNRDIDSFLAADFELVNYEAHKKINMKMAV